MEKFIQRNERLFDKRHALRCYKCDPTFVLLSNDPLRLAASLSRELIFLSCSKRWTGKGILWVDVSESGKDVDQ